MASDSARRADQLQPVAQPLHRGAGGEDRAFERIGDASLASDSRSVASRRLAECGGVCAHVHHQKRAGAERGLGHAGLEAAMADERGLLIAGHAGDREWRGRKDPRRCRRNARRRRAPSGSSARGTLNSAHISSLQARLAMSNSSVRAALVTSVTCARPCVSRQIRNVSTVPNASSPFSARRRSAGIAIEDPGDLGGGEIRIEQQAGRFLHALLVARFAQAARRRRPCADPARRWRDAPARRSCGPRRSWFRADW